MLRTRAVTVAILAAASLALTACGGGTASEVAQSAASSAASSGAPASSQPAPDGSAANGSPSEDGSSPLPAEGGGATDFCGAFEELDAVGDAATDGDAAEVFRNAAADMKKYAPAEIATEANAYADAIAALADTIDGSAGGISAQQAFAEVLAQSTDEIGVLAAYVGKNC
jgi:hypothetical protein